MPATLSEDSSRGKLIWHCVEDTDKEWRHKSTRDRQQQDAVFQVPGRLSLLHLAACCILACLEIFRENLSRSWGSTKLHEGGAGVECPRRPPGSCSSSGSHRTALRQQNVRRFLEPVRNTGSGCEPGRRFGLARKTDCRNHDTAGAGFGGRQA